MPDPKVSVIIPTYNSERHLRATLESVFGQEYDDYEVVIVDDGSTDGTREIIESFTSPRLKVTFAEHAGCVANYNRCLAHSDGEYIAILDHDDIMLPSRLRVQAAFLDTNRHVSIVGSSYDVIDEEGQVLEHKPMPTGHEAVADFELVFNAIQHPTCMYRRRLLDLLDAYDESYYPSHDSDFILRAIQKTGGDNIPEVLTHWRRVPDSPTNTLRDKQHELHYQMRKSLNASKYHAYIAPLRKARYALNLCKIAYYYGIGSEARRWAFRALRHGLRSKELFRYLASAWLMPLVRWLRKRNIILPVLHKQKEANPDWTYYSP